MKLSGVRYLIQQGMNNVWSNRMMAFASYCILTVSLLLIGLSSLVYLNLNAIIGGVADKNEVIVYLQEDTSADTISEIESQLQQIPNINSVSFYSKEQAYADLQSRMTEYEDLFQSLGDENPLIDSFRLRIEDLNNTDQTIEQLQQLPSVLKIRAPFDFINVLTQAKRILSTLAICILTALVIVSLIMISNATKTSVFSRRREITIMKYVGATNAFIRVPFFVEGMLIGFLAGATDTFVTWISYDSLVDLISGQSEFAVAIGLGNVISYDNLYLPVSLAYIGVGAFVGAIGSVLATNRHIEV